MARKAAPPSLEDQRAKAKTADIALPEPELTLEPQGKKPGKPVQLGDEDFDSDEAVKEGWAPGGASARPPESAQALQIDLEKLNALGQVMATKRQEAIDARRNSGIEDVWLEDEEAYQAVDDANRAEEHVASRPMKPASPGGGAIGAEDEEERAIRSTAYLGVTGSYVDAGSARVGDMLLPSDDQPFGVTPTPIPELIEWSKATEPVMRTMPGDKPGAPPYDMRPIAEHVLKLGNERADKAQKRIEDWLVETHWRPEVRAVIEDAARIGTGILKGPYPEMRKQTAFSRGPDGKVQIAIREELKPGSKRVSAWNVYPDGNCGENIQKGAYIWERDDITGLTLRNLRGQPGYIDVQIEAVLKEGPCMPTVGSPVRPEVFGDDTNYEIWYCHTWVTREEMEAAGCDCTTFTQDEFAAVPAMLVMVNNRVINASINPDDTGEYPYDFMCWKRRRNLPWGVGIARLVRTPQRIINGATRNMLDNAALTAGPQIVIMRGVVQPADGVSEITPLKIWYADKSATLQDLKACFMSVEIKSNQADLMAIIQFALKMAEDVTGMPQLMQGQQGSAPDLVGVVQLLNNNANSVLRRIARHFDDAIIEPHIGRYYRWLMQYGEDEEEKGLFVVQARGSSVLVERDIQNQDILNMAPMALNPVFRIAPHKYAKEVFRAKRLDPTRFQYDDAEWAEIEKRMSEQPEDPRIVVAQMRGQMDERMLQLEQRYQSSENAADRQHDMLMKALEQEESKAAMGSKEREAYAKIKAMLGTAVIAAKSKAVMQGRELAYAKDKGRGI